MMHSKAMPCMLLSGCWQCLPQPFTCIMDTFRAVHARLYTFGGLSSCVHVRAGAGAQRGCCIHVGLSRLQPDIRQDPLDHLGCLLLVGAWPNC
jgi:transcriptional regulator GlxA family with amidase domain